MLGLSIAAHPAQAQAVPDWCQRLSSRMQSVSLASCLNSGLLPTGVKSHKGFPILARDIVPANSKTGKTSKTVPPPLRVLLIGGIHGDELTSVAIVFRWLQWAQLPPARL